MWIIQFSNAVASYTKNKSIVEQLFKRKQEKSNEPVFDGETLEFFDPENVISISIMYP